MARNRLIFQSEQVFISPSPATGALTTSGQTFPNLYNNMGGQYSGTSLIDQLTRIQSCSYSVQIPRTDVNQFGELAAIDRIILQQPTVSLDLSYILAGFANEKYIGLVVTPTGQTQQISCISGILSKATDEHNIFVLDSVEGQDVNGNTNINVVGTNVYGFGNMFLSSYTSQGSVGNFPTVDVRFEGLNMVVQTGVQGNSSPAVFPSDGTRVNGWFYTLNNATSHPDPGSGDLTISALRHGDMTLTIFQSGTSTEYVEMGATPSPVSGAIQGYRFSYDLRREDLQKLGTPFAYSKEVQYPLSVSCSVNGLVRDLNTGDLSTIICNDRAFDIELAIKKPGCEATRPVVAKYRLLGAKLDGQSYSLGIGDNKSFTLDFSRQIGSSTQNVGMFLSGTVGN